METALQVQATIQRRSSKQYSLAKVGRVLPKEPARRGVQILPLE
jgi:hypothetical protein